MVLKVWGVFASASPLVGLSEYVYYPSLFIGPDEVPKQSAMVLYWCLF